VTASEPSSRSSTDEADREGLWACGTLGRTHGLTGELYLVLLPHGLEYLSAGERFSLIAQDGGEARPVRLRRTGGTDRRPLVRLEGVDTIDAARALCGSTVMASGAALDEGGFVKVSQLIGARVVCGETELGVVTNVLMNPAHDILEFRASDGATGMVPFVAELVDVDPTARIIHVREGLL
jgi:16S rRNA processing protein RimM